MSSLLQPPLGSKGSPRHIAWALAAAVLVGLRLGHGGELWGLLLLVVAALGILWGGCFVVGLVQAIRTGDPERAEGGASPQAPPWRPKSYGSIERDPTRLGQRLLMRGRWIARSAIAGLATGVATCFVGESWRPWLALITMWLLLQVWVLGTIPRDFRPNRRWFLRR